MSVWTHYVGCVHETNCWSDSRITYSGTMKIIKIIPRFLIRLSHQTHLAWCHWCVLCRCRWTFFLQHHFTIFLAYNAFPQMFLHNFYLFIAWLICQFSKAESLFWVWSALFCQRTCAIGNLSRFRSIRTKNNFLRPGRTRLIGICMLGWNLTIQNFFLRQLNFWLALCINFLKFIINPLLYGRQWLSLKPHLRHTRATLVLIDSKFNYVILISVTYGFLLAVNNI